MPTLPKSSVHVDNRDYAQKYARLINRPVICTIAGEFDPSGVLYVFRAHPNGKLENLSLELVSIMKGVHESILGSTGDLFDAKSKDDKPRKS